MDTLFGDPRKRVGRMFVWLGLVILHPPCGLSHFRLCVSVVVVVVVVSGPVIGNCCRQSQASTHCTVAGQEFFFRRRGIFLKEKPFS